jgi:hypothetical protein
MAIPFNNNTNIDFHQYNCVYGGSNHLMMLESIYIYMLNYSWLDQCLQMHHLNLRGTNSFTNKLHMVLGYYGKFHIMHILYDTLPICPSYTLEIY